MNNDKVIEATKKTGALFLDEGYQKGNVIEFTYEQLIKFTELLQSQSEPVAWQYEYLFEQATEKGELDNWKKAVTFKYPNNPNGNHPVRNIEPLFTHPPLSVNEQLLTEVRELCSLICNSSPDATIKGEIESRAYALGHFPQVIAIAQKKAGE